MLRKVRASAPNQAEMLRVRISEIVAKNPRGWTDEREVCETHVGGKEALDVY